MAADLVKGEGFAVDASLIAANASHQHSVQPGEPCDFNRSEIDTRPMREYLAGLDEETDATASRKISLSDPHSRWTAAKGGVAFFAYSTNYLIDTAHGVILDVEATPAHRNAEVDSTKTMDRVEFRFDLKPQRLIADTAYGTAPMLGWMVDEKAIEPHILCSTRANARMAPSSAMLSSGMRSADEYRRPAGKSMRRELRIYKIPRTHITKANAIIYRARQTDCAGCALKSLCCPNMTSRKIVRSVHERARDVARQIATTRRISTPRCERKKVEMLFAHLKIDLET